MSRRPGATGFKFHGTWLYTRQWQMLELVGPNWLMLKRSAIDWRTRYAAVQKGWLEVRMREDYMMVRLTKAGVAVRDGVHVMRARRQDALRGNPRPQKKWSRL